MDIPEISNPIQGIIMINNDRVQLKKKEVAVNQTRVKINS